MEESQKIKLLIGVPAYGGMCYTAFTESLLQTKTFLDKCNIDFDVKFINNQIVTRARNMISHIFMNDESYTHLLFIDSDIQWNPTHIIMLLEHNLECVIGIYPNKKYYKKDKQIILNPSSDILPVNPLVSSKENLLPIKFAATGFMLLTKSALKRIENDIDTFFLPTQDTVKKVYNYFDCNVVDNNYLTEDYFFSYLFVKNGGEIWADKRISLYHHGHHCYGELSC